MSFSKSISAFKSCWQFAPEAEGRHLTDLPDQAVVQFLGRKDYVASIKTLIYAQPLCKSFFSLQTTALFDGSDLRRSINLQALNHTDLREIF